MLATTAGVVLVIGTAALGVCGLRIRGWVPAIVAFAVLAAAEVVGLTLALSAFSAYERGPMLASQCVLAAAVAAAWLAAGRPTTRVGPLPSPAAVRSFLAANRTVAVVLAAVAVATIVELALALGIAPNSWDSMMYHLSRVALWIQNQGVFGLDGGTVFQVEYAPNGEILYGWTMLLSGGDRLTPLVPWLSAAGCGALVYWGARVLRFPRAPSLFAAGLFLLLPQIVVQATTTLVDLTVAFFVGAFLLFALRAIADGSKGDLVIAAAALGLAVGTKATAFIAVPALVLIIGAALLQRRLPWRPLTAGVATLAVGVMLLGSPFLIQNTIETGRPTGDVGQTRSSSLPTSAARTLWTFVDLPGMAGTLPVELLDPIHDEVWPGELDPSNDTLVSEDVGFGPLLPLLLLPLLAWLVLDRRAPGDRRLVALAAGSFFVTYAVLLEPGPNASHVIVTGVLIAAPLFALAAERSWVRHIAAFASVAFLFPVLMQNSKKPLYPDPVLGADRAVAQSLQHPFLPALERIDELIPQDARLAYIGPSNSTWDYPFFGPGLERWVHRVEVEPGAATSQDEIDAMVAEYDLDAVVWAGAEPPPGTPTTEIGNIAFSDHLVWFVDEPTADAP